VAIPLVMSVSLAVALGAIGLFVRSGRSLSQFGLAACSIRYLRMSLIVGTPCALGVAALTYVFPHKPAIDVASLSLWQLGLYFVVAASIQEEVIFRGLIQSFLQHRWSGSFGWFNVQVSAPVVFTAALFGSIHVGAGPVVALGALALGLVAGELRRRSGSLLPALVVHSLFNLTSMVSGP
jgi:membrane protease YdiL (CAAX protease family)